MSNKTFANWINRKFLDWQFELGERKTLSEFSKYLDIPHPTISTWLTGKRVPNDIDTIQKLSELLGNDIYTVLGKSSKSSDILLQYIITRWDKLTPDEIQKISELFGEAGAGRNAVENFRKSSHG